MAKTTRSITFIFGTDQEDKTITKSFSGYNTTLTDDAISTVGNSLVSNQLFADDDAGVITSIKKAQRIVKEITDVVLTPSV